MMTGADRTVVFLDLTRFTALTDIHGDETAADVIDRFVAVVQTEVDDGGPIVKTLGDGVLLDMRDPGTAITASTMSRECPSSPVALPTAR